jgi:hypothetical protein
MKGGVCYQIPGNVIYAYQVRCVAVHAVTLGLLFFTATRENSEFWRLRFGTNILREKTLAESIGPTELLGVGRGSKETASWIKVTKTDETTADRTAL